MDLDAIIHELMRLRATFGNIPVTISMLLEDQYGDDEDYIEDAFPEDIEIDVGEGPEGFMVVIHNHNKPIIEEFDEDEYEPPNFE